MASQTVTSSSLLNDPPGAKPPLTVAAASWRSLRLALLTSGGLLLLGALFQWLFHPALAAVGVEESFTTDLAGVMFALVPPGFYLMAGGAQREARRHSPVHAVAIAVIVVMMGYAAYVGYQAASGLGPFAQVPSVGFDYAQTDAGLEVLAVAPGSAAEAEGYQVGDIITALRRDPITASDLDQYVREGALDDAFRFRLLRDGEELQLTTRIQLISQSNPLSIFRGLLVALVIGLIGLFIPGRWIPHIILIGAMLPLLAGYLWLIVATFSERTEGFFPVDTAGNFGGWTLNNWQFLSGQSIGGPTINIWSVTLNSFLIAVAITIASLVICSMAGYALSRMTFPGRRTFLSMTLVLHGFPAVTLIIPIYFVLINLGSLPIIGSVIGYNKPGGVALVMLAFELPLGIWLMKGFFDGLSWDMERSALIDGASRWRAFWEIIIPQIRPGLLALGVFSFISGWNAYLIPATYTVGTGLATLPVYIRQLTGEVSPINWNQVAAVGLFQLIPILGFFLFAQEYLLNIYAGGTKGSS